MFSSTLTVCIVFISVFTATDGFMVYNLAHCDFNSTDPNDIEYIYSKFFNKDEIVRFSSSLNKFIGYTEFGVRQADIFNKDPSRMAQARGDKDRYCKHNIDLWEKNILSKSVTPTVRLHSSTPPSSGHPSMLVCSVYDFFPKRIKVTWRRDGRQVTSDVTSTDELEDGDWFYQVHSHLEYTPRSGEKISCVVEHVSLKEPMITDWDPSMPESEKNKIAIGASGLILGLVLSLAGFIYYKRKVRGRILVPTS